MKINAHATVVLLLMAVVFGCAKQRPMIEIRPAAIPATVAIAPVQISPTANIYLPAGGQKILLAKKIASPIKQALEDHLKGKQVFTAVTSIKDDAVPSSPSIPEIALAGKDIGADLVLVGKIIELEGRIVYGFRPSLSEHLAVELSVYDTVSGSRLWLGNESLDISKKVPLSTWSDDMIEANYISLALGEMFPRALAGIVPRLHNDMADYRPAVAQKSAPVETAEFIADVDRVPRTAVVARNNAYAVVIGIESYRDLPQAEFTVRDARIMKEYLVRVMGFPGENIATLLNERATKGDIEGYLGSWLKNNTDGSSTVFIYYGGHGAPNPVTGEPFIIPFDGNPAFLEATAIPLKRIYQLLADLDAREVIMVMDSCFSGSGGRSVMAKGGRPIAITIENPLLASKNIVVMTASKGTEISSSYPAKRHGLFTYFLLKGLQGAADINGDKSVSLSELYSYVAPNVKKTAREENREQTPELIPELDVLGRRAGFALGAVSK